MAEVAEPDLHPHDAGLDHALTYKWKWAAGCQKQLAQEQVFNFAYGGGRRAGVYLLVQGKANMRVPSAASRV